MNPTCRFRHTCSIPDCNGSHRAAFYSKRPRPFQNSTFPPSKRLRTTGWDNCAAILPSLLFNDCLWHESGYLSSSDASHLSPKCSPGDAVLSFSPPSTLPSPSEVTPLIISAWSRELASHPDLQWCISLIDGLSNGARVGFAAPTSSLRSATKYMLSARAHPTVIDQYLFDVCQAGRVAGPFPSPPVSTSTSAVSGWFLSAQPQASVG